MAEDFTLPDPLRIGVVTLSIYITELQDCVNVKRAELGQSPIDVFVSQKTGDTMAFQAIEELKTTINQLAIDFGFAEGVEHPDILGRPYVEHPRTLNLPSDNFPIINDLRKVFEKLIATAPIITLVTLDVWGNYKTQPEPFALMEQASTFDTGPTLTNGLMTMFVSPSEIIEVIGIEGNTKLRSWVIDRFTGDVEFQTQETNLPTVLDITADDEFIYYLAAETDNSISIHRLLKNDRTSIVSSITVQAEISEINYLTREGVPNYSFSSIFNDEDNLYLTGTQFDDSKLQGGSGWSGHSSIVDFEKFTRGALAVVPKSGGAPTFHTFDESLDDLEENEHSAVPWKRMTFGHGAVDDTYIYTRYNSETLWRELNDDPDPYTFIGSTDPRDIVGEENLTNGMVWVVIPETTAGWDEFVMKYEMLVVRWVKPILLPGTWVSHFQPQANWLGQKSISSINVVRINKTSFNLERLEAQPLIVSGAGFTVAGDNLYIKLATSIRVLNKETGDYLGDGATFAVPSGKIKSNEDYTITNPELNIPFLSGLNPVVGAFNVPVSTNISVRVEDDTGVYEPSIKMFVQDIEVTPTAVTPVGNGFDLLYDPPVDFAFEEWVEVRIIARDLAGNKMEDGWLFQIAPEN